MRLAVALHGGGVPRRGGGALAAAQQVQAHVAHTQVDLDQQRR
jgi:hypothetical protein